MKTSKKQIKRSTGTGHFASIPLRISQLSEKLNGRILLGILVLGLSFNTLPAQAVTCPSTEIPSGVTATSTCTVSSGTFTVNTGGAILLNNGVGIQVNAGSTVAVTNLGTINSSSTYQGIITYGTLGTLTNTGAITGYDGVSVGGSINTLVNSGTITGASYSGIGSGSSINTLTNTGTITGATYGIGNSGAAIITLTNTGIITGVSYGINNPLGSIATLNNLQGATSSALTLVGALPSNYNIIINSLSNYGRLAVTSGIGKTTFGIYAGNVSGIAASTISKGTYTSVLSGMSTSKLNNTSGSYGGYAFYLQPASGSATIWDLVIASSSADTQQSLVNTAASLQNTFALQNTVLVNSFAYDCNHFGENDVCISAGGRNTAVAAANGLNNTSALLIAAYRPHPNYRIGAYADQNLSVSNAGSTVNLANNTPLIGLFAAWNQSLDGTGAEVKVSAAYGQKNATVTRGVVGSSDPGSGSSQLASQGAQVTVKYGLSAADNITVSPYVGLRYTQNNMGGYSEASSATVTAPLTYSALNTNATTALVGVGSSYRVAPAVTTYASAGIETDMNTANGSYSGTSPTIPNLTPVNFNASPVKTRPTATLGAYYDLAKNQRLGLTGIYRQESYQAVSTTTVMATYTVGL
jgi:hypothetical protein